MSQTTAESETTGPAQDAPTNPRKTTPTVVMSLAFSIIYDSDLLVQKHHI